MSKVRLPIFLEKMIDESVSFDFKIERISIEDQDNEMYQLMKKSLEFSNISVMYERRVISDQYPVIPKIQYLFGFKPVDGLCLLTANKKHKEVLCDGELFEIIRNSTSFIHSIMYLLVEQKKFQVWSYLPSDRNITEIEMGKQSLQLRRKLFSS